MGDGILGGVKPNVITFYSYKGGTGRSLALAHIANYLFSFNKTVLAIDLDLEAPGLAYKFALLSGQEELPVERGLLDLISTAAEFGDFPQELDSFVVTVAERPDAGRILLLPAGNIYDSSYWLRLAQLSWYDLFYGVQPHGVELFETLLDRLTSAYSPDYVLIDSRTGITEIGGVATALLADTVVCLFTNSGESKTGTREVLRSLVTTRSEYRAGPVNVVPVLTRIPELRDGAERDLVKSIRDFFNEPAPDLKRSASIAEIVVLHTEPTLQLRERLIAPRSEGPHFEEVVLFRDYLRLFSRLVPREVVLPHIDALIGNAKERMFEDPDAAERDLEALVQLYPHPESFRALLKFYRLRRSGGLAMLRAAYRLWDLEKDASDPIIVEVIEKYFAGTVGQRAQDWDRIVNFVYDVWIESASRNAAVGLVLARSVSRLRAGRVAERVLGIVETDTDAAEALELLVSVEPQKVGLEMAQRLLEKFPESDRVHGVVTAALTSIQAVEVLRKLFGAKALDLERLRRGDLVTYVRALTALAPDQVESALSDAVQFAMRADSRDAWLEVGRAFHAVGRLREFEGAIRHVVSDDEFEEIMSRTRADILPRKGRLLATRQLFETSNVRDVV